MEDRAYIHDDEYYYELIRRNMRKFRNQRNFTQQQLADLTDVSREYICDVENTSRNKRVSIAILGRIAEALEKPIGDFFIGDQIFRKGKGSSEKLPWQVFLRLPLRS